MKQKKATIRSQQIMAEKKNTKLFQKALRLFIAIFQEIVAKHFRNFHQLIQIYALPFEHLVYVGLLASAAACTSLMPKTYRQQYTTSEHFMRG